MNFGTKLRTVLGVLTTLNTILAVTDIAQFGNETLTFWYKILSVVVNALVVGFNTYYNNDYTPEAAIGTGITRQLKAEKIAGYVGDVFYEDDDNEMFEDEGVDDIIEEEVDESEIVHLEEEGEKDNE
ncbi:hypothetical protein J6T66_03085 [bacterium]|nr:hypothetical protein [bacterium]